MVLSTSQSSINRETKEASLSVVDTCVVDSFRALTCRIILVSRILAFYVLHFINEISANLSDDWLDGKMVFNFPTPPLADQPPPLQTGHTRSPRPRQQRAVARYITNSSKHFELAVSGLFSRKSYAQQRQLTAAEFKTASAARRPRSLSPPPRKVAPCFSSTRAIAA